MLGAYTVERPTLKRSANSLRGPEVIDPVRVGAVGPMCWAADDGIVGSISGLHGPGPLRKGADVRRATTNHPRPRSGGPVISSAVQMVWPPAAAATGGYRPCR